MSLSYRRASYGGFGQVAGKEGEEKKMEQPKQGELTVTQKERYILTERETERQRMGFNDRGWAEE